MADTLVLNNGDRITGVSISQDDNKIVFRSELIGDIEIDRRHARVEGNSEAIDPVQPGADATTLSKSPTPSPHGWHVDLGMKLALDRGSLKTTENDLDLSADLVRKSDHGELHAKVDYDYKRSDGVLKDDDWLVSFSYDKFLGDDRFAAGRFLGTTELTSAGYDKTMALNAVYGWRFWEADNRYLRIGPAAGYLSIHRGVERFDGPAIGVYLHAKGPVLHQASFDSELQVLDSLGQGRYANLAFRMRQPLSERLYLALAWNYVWSDFDIEAGVKSEWRWDIGWRFGPDESK